MSGGLAPSRSTVYVGNLPFSLTNNDLHKIFEKFGKVVKVTVLKDKVTRDSKGVAFIQYLDRPSAINACKAINKKELFGRQIKCVIATDNGRSAEFIRKRTYPDKSRCYECGEFGHVSYSCSKNVLGEREPPPKKEKRKSKGKKKSGSQLSWDDDDECCSDDNDNQGEDLRESSLSYAIQMNALEEKENEDQAAGEPCEESSKSQSSRKKIKKSAYFSDEEEVEDG